MAQLINGNKGQAEPPKDWEEEIFEEHIHHLRLILPTLLGLHYLKDQPKRVIPEPIKPASEPTALTTAFPTFTLSFLEGTVKAEGYEEAKDRFVVKAGAICRYQVTPSFQKERFQKIRQDITNSLESGILVPAEEDPDVLARLIQDKTFASANDAAMFVCGKSANSNHWIREGTEQTYSEWDKARRAQVSG